MKEPIQVFTTAPNRAIARRIARALIDLRLAACVQILGPIVSTYRWQGQVENAREWLCLIKTSRARFRELSSTVEGLHPYDTPEIVALPIAAGNRRYLAWLAASVRPLPARPRSARRPGCR
ncbi:divalent-cation tolerance protein CutA [candidate division WOR-3 bacterium]|nr:divalent-cation tolerance protein CutA [candidate division WOR-3 bacterium]